MDATRGDGSMSAKERQLKVACGEGFRVRGLNQCQELIGLDRDAGTYNNGLGLIVLR